MAAVIIPADFSPTPEGLARVRRNLLKSGYVGRLVANDFTAAIVSAELMEFDPETGRRLDFIAVAEEIEDRIRAALPGTAVLTHLDAIQDDVVENLRDLVGGSEGSGDVASQIRAAMGETPALRGIVAPEAIVLAGSAIGRYRSHSS